MKTTPLHSRCHRLALRYLSAVAIVSVMIGPAIAAETRTLGIDPSHTVVQFKLRHMLGRVTGRLRGARGVLDINPDAPERASLVITIASRSIDTGIPLRDKHLRDELFEVAKFPEITFRSRTIIRTANDRADVTGDLALHGVTRPFVLHVTLLGANPTSAEARVTRWRATGTFKRSTFELRWSNTVEAASMIGDDIDLEIQAEAARLH